MDRREFIGSGVVACVAGAMGVVESIASVKNTPVTTVPPWKVEINWDQVALVSDPLDSSIRPSRVFTPVCPVLNKFNWAVRLKFGDCVAWNRRFDRTFVLAPKTFVERAVQVLQALGADYTDEGVRRLVKENQDLGVTVSASSLYLANKDRRMDQKVRTAMLADPLGKIIVHKSDAIWFDHNRWDCLEGKS